MTAEASIDAVPIPEAPAVRRRPARRLLTRDTGVEALMALYGAGMLCWFFAVILSPVPDGAGLAPLWTVMAAWAAGAVPAYLAASLAVRRLPVA